VSLKPPSERVVTVDYAVRGGSAKGNGVDYRLAGGTLVFSPGETRKTIEIEIVGDAPGEEDKTVDIGLFAPENAVLGECPWHTYTILGQRKPSADPSQEKRILPEVTFDRSSQTVREDMCGVAARMVLTFATDWDVAIPFEFGGTARTPEDFRSLTESPLVIRAGAQSSGIVIAMKDNDRIEKDRTIEIAMGIPTNASPPAVRKHTITIRDDDRQRVMAVIPFFNQSTRKNAGDMMSLHFIRHLVAAGGFRIVEPGEIREKLLDLRIIMEDGISLANADDLFRRLDADMILTGRVLDYQDSPSGGGIPVVDFSVLVLERKGRSVIWHSRSRNRGDDGVFFFNLGVVRTPDMLAGRMVGTVVDHMLK
jgi:hypothetical protein